MTKKETMNTVDQATKENIEANNAVFNLVRQKCGFKNDAALSRALQVAPPVVSKLRHGRLQVGPSIIVKLHEVSGIPVRELKSHMGLCSLPQHIIVRGVQAFAEESRAVEEKQSSAAATA